MQVLPVGRDALLAELADPAAVPLLYADLRRELAERNRQLEIAQAKLDLELNLARKVQLGLMPRAPRPQGVIRLAVRYQPANQLGGDVYDFAALDGGRLGVLVADVSGHGVNAALLSGMVKTLAAPLMAADRPPGGVDHAACVTERVVIADRVRVGRSVEQQELVPRVDDRPLGRPAGRTCRSDVTSGPSAQPGRSPGRLRVPRGPLIRGG